MVAERICVPNVRTVMKKLKSIRFGEILNARGRAVVQKVYNGREFEVNPALIDQRDRDIGTLLSQRSNSPVEFASGFLSSSLDKLPLKKSVTSAGGLTSFSRGLNPH